MAPADPYLSGRRRSVWLAATGAIVVLLLIAVKFTSMQIAQAAGESAWRSGDQATAERRYATTSHGNVVQRWIAPYNRGVVAYGDRRWLDAASWFESAMESAPTRARCRIALNWSWSLEAAGDALETQGDERGAARRWEEALAVLDQGLDCSEDASSSQPTSATPSPEPQEPEESPAAEPSPEPAREGDSPGSEQGQRDETADRLDQKRTGGSGHGQEQEQPDEVSGDEKADELAERNRQAGAARERAEDNRPGDADRPQGRTW